MDDNSTEGSAPDTPQPQGMQFTQEEVDSAAAMEDNLLLQSQVNHLRQRVIILRAAHTRLANRLREEGVDPDTVGEDLAPLTALPQDRRPRTSKRAAAKKAAKKP